MVSRTACVVAFLLAAPVFGAPPGIERWNVNHPEAATELGQWVKNHPEAAERFFEWDGRHPERSREFVTWTIGHPGENIDIFVKTHPGWPLFDVIMERHRPAADAFMAWSRRHPRAAETLMMHPRGLEWAGHHLWAQYWGLEHPRR
jgi:hypothetical protein